MQTEPITREHIVELTPGDINSMRFSDWARTTNEAVRRTLARYPGRSLWVPRTGEYAIVAPWRHRDEIANVVELSAVRHPATLLDEVVRRAAVLGAKLVVALEVDESRQPAFYARAGFEVMERVVTYEYEIRGDELPPSGPLEARPADPADPSHLAALIEIDRATFPWVWWNTAGEFLSHLEEPGIESFLCFWDGRPVCYVTLTAYLGWGHLDRIAVLPEAQGRGIGMAALRFAVARLARIGARRVGLSTQTTNERSRRLYERYGFRRVNDNDYRLYGRLLRTSDGIERLT